MCVQKAQSGNVLMVAAFKAHNSTHWTYRRSNHKSLSPTNILIINCEKRIQFFHLQFYCSFLYATKGFFLDTELFILILPWVNLHEPARQYTLKAEKAKIQTKIKTIWHIKGVHTARIVKYPEANRKNIFKLFSTSTSRCQMNFCFYSQQLVHMERKTTFSPSSYCL